MPSNVVNIVGRRTNGQPVAVRCDDVGRVEVVGGGAAAAVVVIQPNPDLLNANANMQVGDVDASNANPVPVSDAGGSLTVDDGAGSLTVDQATHDNLNANANMQVGDVDVANGNPVPVSDAGGTLTVDQATHDNLNANANMQIGDVDVGDANAVPTDEWIETGVAWLTLVNDIRLDDDPTSYNSAAQDSDGYAGAWVLIDIDSTLAPTSLRILPQWSHDAGTTWWDFEEGFWASLYWEDTATASGVNKAFNLPLGGIDTWRIRAVAVGTDATNYFDVTVLARHYRGSVGMAHA